MLAWLDPQNNFMPITGYEQAHDVGRWWDAMLRLEHATGFSIPAHMEGVMLANLKRLTEKPARLLVVDTKGGGEAAINPHNLRETMLDDRAPVELCYVLPARTTEEKYGITTWRLTWRGDVVVNSLRAGSGEPQQAH